MNRFKKMITAAGLLIIISLPGLLLIHYQLMQLHIRHQMEEKLEKQFIQTVRVPVHEIEWYRKDKEIIIAGKLFDIKSVSIENQVAVFEGLFDVKETSIKEQILALQQQQENSNEKNRIVEKLVSTILFYEENSPQSSLYNISSSVNYYQRQSDIPLSTQLSPPAPPPKL